MQATLKEIRSPQHASGFAMRGMFLSPAVLTLLLMFAAVPIQAMAAAKAGKVIMAKGSVEAIAGDSRRQLKRRSAVHTSEVVTTAKDSRAQIRFVDGALLTLEQESELAIEEYSYQSESGKPDQVLMRLVKGGLRTVTGAIGKSNQQAYQLNTPLATIGIRGTMFRVDLDQAAGVLEVSVDQGTVEVLNEFGSLLIGVGQPHRFAQVHPGSAPEGAEIAAPARVSPSGEGRFELAPDYVSTEPEQNPEYLDQLESLKNDRSTAQEVSADGTAPGTASEPPPQEIPP